MGTIRVRFTVPEEQHQLSILACCYLNSLPGPGLLRTQHQVLGNCHMILCLLTGGNVRCDDDGKHAATPLHSRLGIIGKLLNISRSPGEWPYSVSICASSLRCWVP